MSQVLLSWTPLTEFGYTGTVYLPYVIKHFLKIKVSISHIVSDSECHTLGDAYENME